MFSGLLLCERVVVHAERTTVLRAALCHSRLQQHFRRWSVVGGLPWLCGSSLLRLIHDIRFSGGLQLFGWLLTGSPRQDVDDFLPTLAVVVRLSAVYAELWMRAGTVKPLSFLQPPKRRSVQSGVTLTPVMDDEEGSNFDRILCGDQLDHHKTLASSSTIVLHLRAPSIHTGLRDRGLLLCVG